MIGIVGGVGPLAGVDIMKKIIEETDVVTDQEHLSVLLSSQPQRIVDRTAYLLGDEPVNPGYALAEIAIELGNSGATVAAVPCNTAHAPAIFDVVKKELAKSGLALKLLHLIEETAAFIQEQYPGATVGVLSTTGTRDTGLYKNVISSFGLTHIAPDDDLQAVVHEAIYDETFGIKACSSPVTDRAQDSLLTAIKKMRTLGVDVIILGCTELPLALSEQSYYGIPVVDPNRILARALIREIEPGKLRFSGS